MFGCYDYNVKELFRSMYIVWLSFYVVTLKRYSVIITKRCLMYYYTKQLSNLFFKFLISNVLTVEESFKIRMN